MDIVAAFGLVGTYRGAAEICGTTHRTVRKVVREELARMGGHDLPARRPRVSNTQVARDVVIEKVKISAKRLLPAARLWGLLPIPSRFRAT
jgi:hypothetical protein